MRGKIYWKGLRMVEQTKRVEKEASFEADRDHELRLVEVSAKHDCTSEIDE